MRLLKWLFFISCFASVKGGAFSQSFSRGEYYAVLESQDTSRMQQQLDILNATDMKEKNAWSGAMTMRRSGLVKSPAARLKGFKSGKLLLESAIRNDSTNAEFRFLRLIIQENCPDFLRYHYNKEEDAKAVKQGFKKFPKELQLAVRNYSKKSKALSAAGLPEN